MKPDAFAGLALCAVAFGAVPAFGQETTTTRLHLLSAAPLLAFAQDAARGVASALRQSPPRVEASAPRDTITRFCAGTGPAHPDMIVLADRLSSEQLAGCRTRGVTRIAEIGLGYEALVLVNKADGPAFDLTRSQIFLAVARWLPQAGRLIANPYRRWKQIDPALPDRPIRIFGPPPGSVAETSLRLQVLAPSCRAVAAGHGLSPATHQALCRELRDDNAYRAAAADYNHALTALRGGAESLVLMPYSLHRRDCQGLALNAVEGAMPTEAAIAEGRYPLRSRVTLYVKAQDASRLASLRSFAVELARRGGQDRLLAHGLVPLPRKERIAQRLKAHVLKPTRYQPLR